MEELLYQSLETEQGGVRIYETAVQCAQNDDVREEWTKYLEETRNHETIMLRVLDAFGLSPDTQTPGRQIVHTKAETLVQSMQTALSADPAAAQLVAAECIVEAESKDHTESPQEADVPTEEDISPRDAPAEPAREI